MSCVRVRASGVESVGELRCVVVEIAWSAAKVKGDESLSGPANAVEPPVGGSVVSLNRDRQSSVIWWSPFRFARRTNHLRRMGFPFGRSRVHLFSCNADVA